MQQECDRGLEGLKARLRTFVLQQSTVSRTRGRNHWVDAASTSGSSPSVVEKRTLGVS